MNSEKNTRYCFDNLAFVPDEPKRVVFVDSETKYGHSTKYNLENKEEREEYEKHIGKLRKELNEKGGNILR